MIPTMIFREKQICGNILNSKTRRGLWKESLKKFVCDFRGIYNLINSRETTKTKGRNKLYADNVKLVGE